MFLGVDEAQQLYMRLKGGKWETTSSLSLASKVGKKAKMENVINDYKRLHGGTWKVVSDKEIIAHKDLPDVPDGAGISGNEILDALQALRVALHPKKREVLSVQMSDVDKELSDVYHYIELSNLNAAQGYKAYKDLQQVLKRRRAIKNDMALVQALTPMIDGAISQAMVIYTGDKEYKPRVRSDLFN